MRKRVLSKLNVKIVLLIMTITMVVSSITGMALFRYFAALTADQLKRDNQMHFDQIVGQMDGFCEEAVRYGQQISSDPQIQGFLSKDVYQSAVDEIGGKTEIANYLGRMKALSQSIDSIALVKGEEVAVWTEIPFWDAPTRELCQEWYRGFCEAAGSPDTSSQSVSLPYTFSYLTKGGVQHKHLISIYMPNYSIKQMNNRSGGLIINIAVDNIKKVLQTGSGGFDQLAYFSGTKEPVFASGSTADTKALLQTVRGGSSGSTDRFPIYFSSNTLLGGTLVSVLDFKSPFSNIWGNLRILLLILMMAALLIVVLLVPIMLHLTKPVTVLAGAMKQVSAGDMDTRVDIRSQDEFEILGHELNRMVKRLDDYIQATLQHEKDKHELEYEVLVAQINPHFIYNTLNTVIYLAKKERSQDVIHITKALIDLLQDGIKLSDNKNYSTVKEELWIIQNYVLIQNYRYANRFELVVDCPGEMEEKEIPASVIQPLIENALFHGIVPMDRAGTIWLKLGEEEREGVPYIRVCVCDNGVGIPREKVEAVMSGTFQQIACASRNHVGVQNIVKRLSLLYGDSYTMSISARKEGGTQVAVCFPARPPR